MELLDKLPELIQEYGAYLVLIGGVIMELVARLLKTDKPMSLIRKAAGAVRAVAKVLDALSGILDRLVADKTK